MKRYDLSVISCDDGSSFGQMKDSADGMYVLFDDIEKLLNPGSRPCGCCNKATIGAHKFYLADCDCGNIDDAKEAGCWCRTATEHGKLTGDL